MGPRGLLAAISAAGLLLGGCGSGDGSEGPAGNDRAAAPVPPTAAPPPPAPARPEPVAAPATAIPAPYLGVYDGSAEACARPSIERLRVAPRELRFHESIGIVRTVSTAPSGAIRVEADYEGEGESWRSVRELRLSDGGERLTVSGDGTSLTRIRCPDGTL